MTSNNIRVCAASLRLSFLAGVVGLTGCGGNDMRGDTQGDVETELPLDCDIPQLFVDSCGGAVCHSAGGTTAAGLDLASPGVEDRVSGVPGLSCSGVLASPAFPEDSLLYQKVAESPECGARMPLNGAPLDDDEMACLRAWISGLLPPGSADSGGDTADTGMDGGTVCDPGETQDCYTGPDGTANVGICMGGSWTCEPTGQKFGPCIGEVTPQGEDCFTADIDENCDGLTPACSELWSHSFGDMNSQSLSSGAVDANGDVYVLGDFEGTVSFGGEPLAASGDKADIVLAKYDLYGNPLWSKRYGDSSNQYAAKLIVDAQGNLIVVGRIYGHLDFGGGEIKGAGAADVVIAKLDRDGNHIWSRGLGDINPDRAERVAVDTQGNVLLTGTFTGAVDYGSGLFMSEGLRDAFVLKIDGGTGASVFAKQIGGPGDDYGFGIDADALDNVVVAGRFHDSISLGGGMDSAGMRDIYVAKLNPLGAVVWAQRFGGSGDDSVEDLAVRDTTGEIVMVGFMSESVNFGGPNLDSAGSRDIFLATLDEAGGHVWSKRFGDAADQFTTNTYALNTWMSLTLDSMDHIYIAGALLGSVNFGGAAIASAGENPDVFFAKFSAGGDLVANNRYGGTGTDIALDIAVTNTGHVVITGRSFASYVDFGASGMVENQGLDDGFIVKLLP